jgi:hypothetical protein
MLSEKMRSGKSGKSKMGAYIALFLVGFIVVALAAGSDVLAAGKVKAYGMLTSVEDDGSVIINEKGYLMSPSANVLNYQGKHILLSDLLPSRYVQFEYEQTTRGFVIIFIKEIPQ